MTNKKKVVKKKKILKEEQKKAIAKRSLEYYYKKKAKREAEKKSKLLNIKTGTNIELRSKTNDIEKKEIKKDISNEAVLKTAKTDQTSSEKPAEKITENEIKIEKKKIKPLEKSNVILDDEIYLEESDDHQEEKEPEFIEKVQNPSNNSFSLDKKTMIYATGGLIAALILIIIFKKKDTPELYDETSATPTNQHQTKRYYDPVSKKHYEINNF